MSKIARSISNSVTLGTGRYLNPLTITAQGTIASGSDGVVVPANYLGATIVNHGNIGAGAQWGNYTSGDPAIYSASNLNLSNHGSIHGGNGGDWGSSGGNGVDVSGAAIVSNSGQISGGIGVYATYGGGSGGAGIDINGSLNLTNTGTITGGYGGWSGYYGGNGGAGVDVSGTGTIINRGAIVGGIGAVGGSHYGASGAGLIMTAGGTVMNSGFIGVDVGGSGVGLAVGADSYVVNSGTINGSASVGADSRVVNSGTIVAGGYGLDGVYAGTNSIVVNSGMIESGQARYYVGVDMAGGTLTNANGATIEGGVGVIFQSDGTLVNAGNIYGDAGGSGYAVQFDGSQSTLIIDPGAKFSGKVTAPGGSGDVLELAGKAAGTLQYLGSQFIGFGTIEEDRGGHWTLADTNTLGHGDFLLVSGNLQVSGSLDGAGSITVEKHGVLAPSGTGTIVSDNLKLDYGTISASAQSVFAIGTTSLNDAAGSITIDSGATLSGNGWIVNAPLVDNGTLIAKGGALRLQSDVSGSGVLTINPGASVFARYTLGVASIDFTSGGKEDLLATPSGITGTISGFSKGDTIDIRLVEATTLSFLAGTLTLLDGVTPVDEISLAGDYDTGNFSLESDGHGGFDIGYVANGEQGAGGVFATHAFIPPTDFLWHMAHW